MSAKAGHLAVCQLLVDAGANTTYETVSVRDGGVWGVMEGWGVGANTTYETVSVRGGGVGGVMEGWGVGANTTYETVSVRGWYWWL